MSPWQRLLLIVCPAFCSLSPTWGAPPPASSEKEPRQEKAVRVDRYGDPLPPGALARLGTVRLRHRSEIWSVVFSRDGKQLYANELCDAGKGAPTPLGVIRVWDTTTGKLARCLEGQPYGSGHLALSPDGKLLASESGACLLWIWDLEKGKPICRLERTREEGNLIDTAFSPDGKTLAVIGIHPTIQLWDVRAGKLLRQFPNKKGGWRLLYSRDGKRIASVGVDGLHLWEVVTGKEVWRLPAPEGGFHGLALSPDGKTFAVGDDGGSIRLVDSASGKPTRRWRAHQGRRINPLLRAVNGLAFSPGGTMLASGGDDGVVRLWDPASGKQIRQLDGHQDLVYGVAFSPDGKTLASGSHDRTVRLWDVASGKERFPFPGHTAAVFSVVFAPDGRTLASGDSRDDRVILWDTFTGRELRSFLVDPRGIPDLSFSPNGKRLVTVTPDGTLQLCETITGKTIRSFKGHTGAIRGLSLSPDGKRLVSSDSATIRVWDVATGEEVRRVDLGKGDGVYAFAHSAGGALGAGSADRSVYVWSVEAGKPVLRFTAHHKGVTALALSPDGKLLASAESDFIRLWDLSTGKELRRFTGREGGDIGGIGSLAFAPDGRTLVWGEYEGAGVRVCEVASGQEVFCFQGHPEWVHCVSFSPTGRVIASGSEDATVLLWDVTGLHHGEDRPAARLPTSKLGELWEALAGDAPRAYRATWRMASVPAQAVPFLMRRLAPVQRVPTERIARLIADLEDARFSVRERATDELEGIGELALPALRKALAGRPSLELRRRASEVVAKIEAPVPPPRRLREIRAVAALEYAGTDEARRLLRSLADGAPETRLTQEAKASLRRLGQRPTP
jgi:WD40 repeat protein